MTATLQPFYTIFESQDPTERDAAFEIDELRDIANYGMSAGVPGFIYTKDNVAWFDENEDEIEEYLSDWYHDNMGDDNYLGAIASPDSGHAYPASSIDELKTRMVWMYVELKAHDILCSVDPNY